ncbi:MAG: substrate-binding domain-containing protein [Candidatus Zipacnadales bacterium]
MLYTSRVLTASIMVVVLGNLVLSGCPKHEAPPTSDISTAPTAALPTPSAAKYKVVISSRPGQWNLDERVRGYQETFAKYYPEIEVIQVIDDETKYEVGARQAAAMLSAHPDIAGFAGVNAASGPGIADAVKAAQKAGQIPIIAMDADSKILDLIEEGVITASVAQRQYYMTYIGVKYLYGLKHGYFRLPGDSSRTDIPELPTEIDTGVVEVNADNVDIFRTVSQGAKEELDEKHPDWKALLADRKVGEFKKGEEYVAIGISTGVEYWNATKAGLDDVAAELGVKCTFEGPLDHNPEQQASILDRIAARRPAGILIAPGEPNVLKPYIDKAIDEGINVICFDTDAPNSKRLAYYGTSNYDAGVMGAHLLAKALGLKAPE